ncbi:MAG: DinB family protein [Chloroflexota bacterium]
MDFLAKARRQMLAGQVNDAREKLTTSYEGLSEEEMLEPGVDGEKSVRDILANIAAWDRAYAETFRAMMAGERHPLLDVDEEGVESFNAEQDEASRGKPFEEVLADLSSAWDELIEVLQQADNAQLFAPAPGDESADMSIAACLSVIVSEDEQHADLIEEWRANREA